MIKRFFVSLVLFALILGGVVRALEFPPPQGYVNDFARILSPQTRQILEQKLVQFEKDSTVEIAVVTVDSLRETTIEDYAVRLFEDWKIGKKGKDNGVLLLVAPGERELRIEVGYGLESVLTDNKAGRIIRNTITPRFKKGDYDAGVTEGVEVIISVVSGEAVGLGQEPFSGNNGFLIFLVVIIIFVIYIFSFLARSKSFWQGGVFGAVLGAGLGLITGTSFAVTSILLVFFGILGLIFDYILSRNYRTRKSRNLSNSWRSSWGGFSSSSSGGFGGFGGGSSGGGGAGGRW